MGLIDLFYNLPDDTIRMEFSGKPEEDLVKKMREAGFRYWPGRQINVAKWCTPAEDLALEIGKIEKLEVREKPDDADARVDGFVLMARKAKMRAEAEERKVHAIAENIPFGQPILVGHHSEGHARRDAERIDNGMRRSCEELEKENYWRGRAEGAERRKKQQEDPGVIARRIDKLEAERRKIIKDRAQRLDALEQLIREDLGYGKVEEIRLDHVNNAVQDALAETYTLRTPKPDERADWSSRNAWNEMERSIRTAPRSMRWYERALAHNELVHSYQRQLYQDSGGVPMEGKEIKAGYFVRNHRHWCRVIKVNRKTVTLDYSWLDMPPAKLEITKIQEIQTPEEHYAVRQQSLV